MNFLAVFLVGGATGAALQRPLKRAATGVVKRAIRLKRELKGLAAELEEDVAAELAEEEHRRGKAEGRGSHHAKD
jgi:hypothetical protein